MVPVIIAGIFMVLLFSELARYETEISEKVFHMWPLPRRMREIGFLLVGVFFITYALRDLVEISPGSTVVLVLGIISARLSSTIGRVFTRLAGTFIHVEIPVILSRILCLVLGLSLVVVAIWSSV